MDSFPHDFLWGTATSAPQIEGAAHADGKGDSIWDTFSRQPGKVFSGHTPEVACDFYHRWRDDIAMMKAAGIQAFRFSIAWPRVMPDGTGRINEAGLSFYDRLIDGLLGAGIQPFVTLYHWDLPQVLQDRGGWRNREIAAWFGAYADVMARKLGDRVKHWITLNEPQIFLGFGYKAGTHAPGLTLGDEETFACVHHSNLAHAHAVAAIRSYVPHALTGMAQVGYITTPADEADAADIAIAKQLTLEPVITGDHETFLHTAWWSDPMFHGTYPVLLERSFPRLFDHVIRAGDLQQIHGTADFFGYNYYFGRRARATSEGFEIMPIPPGAPRTAIGWPLHPEGIHWGSRFFHEAFAVPQFIFENGLSSMDWVSLDGRVHDASRIDFLTRYLREVKRTIDAGIPLHGWFHWSWLDNFEWAEGYKERFGLVHVDYATQRRTAKDSLAWLSEVIRRRGQNIG